MSRSTEVEYFRCSLKEPKFSVLFEWNTKGTLEAKWVQHLLVWGLVRTLVHSVSSFPSQVDILLSRPLLIH